MCEHTTRRVPSGDIIQNRAGRMSSQALLIRRSAGFGCWMAQCLATACHHNTHAGVPAYAPCCIIYLYTFTFQPVRSVHGAPVPPRSSHRETAGICRACPITLAYRPVVFDELQPEPKPDDPPVCWTAGGRHGYPNPSWRKTNALSRDDAEEPPDDSPSVLHHVLPRTAEQSDEVPLPVGSG